MTQSLLRPALPKLLRVMCFILASVTLEPTTVAASLSSLRSAKGYPGAMLFAARCYSQHHPRRRRCRDDASCPPYSSYTSAQRWSLRYFFRTLHPCSFRSPRFPPHLTCNALAFTHSPLPFEFPLYSRSSFSFDSGIGLPYAVRLYRSASSF